MSMRILPPLLFAALLASCSSTSVQHDFDPRVDLASFSSFGVLPNPNSVNDTMAMSVLGYDDIPILVAISVLEKKGFTHEESGTVDFYVGVRTKVVVPGNASFQPQPAGNGLLALSAWDPGGVITQSPMRSAVYQQGAGDFSDPGGTYGDPDNFDNLEIYLFVDVFDADSWHLIWQGWTRSGSLTAFSTDSKRAKKIESILETFPK